MSARPIGTRYGWISGMKLEIAATPAAVDTATVRT